MSRALAVFCFAATIAVSAAEAREVQAHVSVMSFSNFVLDNDVYSVRYSDRLSGMPGVHLGVAEPLGDIGPVQVSGQLHLGVGTREASVPVSSRAGRGGEEKVAVTFLPLAFSTRFLYQFPGVRFIKPTLTTGVGIAWTRQHGMTEGISHTFWLPHYFVRPGFTFLDATGGDSPDQWFAGFTFGIAFQNTFGTRQSLRTWSFDLSVNFIL